MRFPIGAAALAACLAASPAMAECDPGETVIRFSHTDPADSIRGRGAAALAREIERAMDGRACMRVTAGATDHAEASLVEALQEGAFEMGAIPTGSLGRVSPRFLVFDLPFLFDDVESVLAFQASDTGRDLLAEVGRAGLVGLGFWLDGFKQIAADRAVSAPADLSGLRMGVGESEVARATAEALGTVPVAAGGDPRALVEAGRADAVTASWADIRARGLDAVQTGFTETNHTISSYVLVAAPDFWEGLDAGLRGEIGLAAKLTAHERNRLAFEVNEAAKHAMLQEGTEIRELDAAERLAFKRAMQTVWFGFGGEVGFDQISTALHVNRTR